MLLKIIRPVGRAAGPLFIIMISASIGFVLALAVLGGLG
jgi:hypothetical protein